MSILAVMLIEPLQSASQCKLLVERQSEFDDNFLNTNADETSPSGQNVSLQTFTASARKTLVCTWDVRYGFSQSAFQLGSWYRASSGMNSGFVCLIFSIQNL